MRMQRSYLFKCANFKWQLFKRHAIMVGQQHRRFKRPSGMQWVAHQVDALDTFHNLYTLLGYLHNQIADPYNATLCKEQQRLKSILSNCSNLVVLIFNVIKSDILRLIRPTSLVLESVSVLLREAITTSSISLRKYKNSMKSLKVMRLTLSKMCRTSQNLQQISYHYLNLMKLVPHLAVVPEENQPVLELPCILDTP